MSGLAREVATQRFAAIELDECTSSDLSDNSTSKEARWTSRDTSGSTDVMVCTILL
jgi:hypothetical protein